MKSLFITKFMDGNTSAIILELQVVLFAVAVVFISMVIDLYFGIRKAKELGEMRTSYGLRRTVKKFIEYMLTMLIALGIDVLASIVEDYSMPYVCFLAAAYLVYTEIVSIREKAGEKQRRKQNADALKLLEVLRKNNVIDAAEALLTETPKEEINEECKSNNKTIIENDKD